MSPKTLRAFLRREFPRTIADHGAEWCLTPEQVAAARARFCKEQSAFTTAPITPVSAHLASPPQGPLKCAPLRSYVRPGLDVLFVALNPPTQSASNEHWFSGEQSAFFKLLHLSGLITRDIPKSNADEIVFGSTSVNLNGACYGVTDLRPNLVETNSGKVRISGEHFARLIDAVRESEPRIVCIIHGKIRTGFNKLVGRFAGVVDTVEVGQFTSPLAGCVSRFICNHFPNGNGITDQVKVNIFRAVRDAM